MASLYDEIEMVEPVSKFLADALHDPTIAAKAESKQLFQTCAGLQDWHGLSDKSYDLVALFPLSEKNAKITRRADRYMLGIDMDTVGGFTDQGRRLCPVLETCESQTRAERLDRLERKCGASVDRLCHGQRRLERNTQRAHLPQTCRSSGT